MTTRPKALAGAGQTGRSAKTIMSAPTSLSYPPLFSPFFLPPLLSSLFPFLPSSPLPSLLPPPLSSFFFEPPLSPPPSSLLPPPPSLPPSSPSSLPPPPLSPLPPTPPPPPPGGRSGPPPPSPPPPEPVATSPRKRPGCPSGLDAAGSGNGPVSQFSQPFSGSVPVSSVMEAGQGVPDWAGREGNWSIMRYRG